jgi:hypothetical protein
MTAVRAALIAVLMLLVPAPAASWAHVRSTEGHSEIEQDGDVVRYALSLESGVLESASGAATAPDRDAALEAYLLPRVQVFLDGVECEGALEAVALERRQGRDYTRSVLAYECPGSASGGYEVRYGAFADGGVVDDHTNVADFRLGGEAGTFVFDAGHRRLTSGDGGLLSSAPRFVALGIEHILLGLDHVLFLALLLLGARSLGSVARLATTFTVAHSATLALAALGWLRVPSEIVEPLIALSIAYVAAENILGGESRHRLAVVFGFGLLHGLGFAGTLSFTDELDGRLLAALLSFNFGIELGQALIVAALFPALLLLRRFRWSPAAHAGAAVGAGALGLLWFFDRLIA